MSEFVVTKLHTVIFQVTYLIDEAFNVGKGANLIISTLHHFFQTHRIGEKSVHLHADNCAGQNKNRFMMYYLMWRVRTGLHEEVTISFLPVGHTKFSPDWCFGLMKQCFRRTKIVDLDDIANCVSLSSSVNVPQLVGSLDGTTFVPTYNWSEYFEDRTIKTALKGITQMQHFRFSSSSPGAVFVKSVGSAAEQKINLLKDMSWAPSANQLPQVVVPMGLSAERQQYLYDKIREFCPPEKQDSVCPKPI